VCGAALFAVALVAGGACDAAAQGYIGPFIGYDFGGDASCRDLTNCEDKRLNAGVWLGVTGAVFGFEEEFAYAKDFFGVRPAVSSSLLTVMSNVMLIPRIGPVRPYGLLGLGLIKSHVELSPSSLFTADNNNFGWDVGGGVMINFGRHFGIRGDVRYFHSFQDFTVLFIPLGGQKLDFGRASGGILFGF